MGSVSKQEFRYVLSAVIFGLIWFLIVIPVLLEQGIEGSNPYLQFLIFNIGIFVFLQIFLKSKTLKSGIQLKNTIGIIFLVMALDVMIPPFLINMQGELLDTVVLKASGTDYIAGYFAINQIGLGGISVFLFTYVVVPAIFLFIAAHLLPNLVREV